MRSGFFIDLPRVIIELSLITLLGIIIFINIESSENYDIFLKNLAFLGALVFRAKPSISKIMYQGGSISLKYNKLGSLSEQNLVDCSYDFGNEGCDGGWPALAIEFIINGKIMNLEKPKMNSGKKKNGIGFLFSYQRNITF